MTYLAGILLLIVIFVRPQEFVPALEGLPFLNAVVALGFIGIAYEFGTGQQKDGKTPQGNLIIVYLIWCVISTMIQSGTEGFTTVKTDVGFSAIFCVIIMYGTRTPVRFIGLTTVLLGVALFLATAATIQGRSPFLCIELDQDPETRGSGEVKSVGGECENRRDCWDKDESFDDDPPFVCEKLGIAGTFSTAGRVRWRGKLQDPNELSMTCSAALAFAFAFHGLLKSWWRHLMLGGAIAVTMYCVILSQSRGGTLVIGIIFLAAFVRRFGWKGALLGIAAAAPGILLGGRSGEEAEASAEERTDLLREGFEMMRQFPLGVGVRAFGDHTATGLTAHNSYVLEAAEVGLPGMWLWALIVYTSIKIPYVVGFRSPAGLDPRIKGLGNGLFVAYCGMLVGIFFLSFAYHSVLWTFFGLSGGLYGVARRNDPTFEIKLSQKEIIGVCVSCVVFLIALFGWLKVKGSH